MDIFITAEELIDKGIWEDLCILYQWNPWIVNEGLMDITDKIKVSEEDAKTIGLI